MDEGPSTLLATTTTTATSTQAEGSGSGPAIFLEELEREWESEGDGSPAAVEIETQTHVRLQNNTSSEEGDKMTTATATMTQDREKMIDAEKDAVTKFNFDSQGGARATAETKPPKRGDPSTGFEVEDSGSGDESMLVEGFPNAKISVEITLTKLTSMEPLDGPYTGNTEKNTAQATTVQSRKDGKSVFCYVVTFCAQWRAVKPLVM